MHRKAFARLNAERVEQGEVTYANPRNFSAGTIKMQNSGEVARRPLDCFLYFLLGPQLPYKTHEERSEEHTSELQSLMRISYAVFCLKKKTKNNYPMH